MRNERTGLGQNPGRLLSDRTIAFADGPGCSDVLPRCYRFVNVQRCFTCNHLI